MFRTGPSHKGCPQSPNSGDPPESPGPFSVSGSPGPWLEWAVSLATGRRSGFSGPRMGSQPVWGVPQASLPLTISWCTPPPARGNRPQTEFGGPLAHALQALPHRGHGPAASAARSSDPGLPLVRDRWPGPGPHGLQDPIRAARPVRAEGSEAQDRGPLFPPRPLRGPAGDLAASAGSSGARRVAGALSGERAVSWSRTPVGRRAGLRREAGAGAGARGRGGPASGASRGRESGV